MQLIQLIYTQWKSQQIICWVIIFIRSILTKAYIPPPPPYVTPPFVAGGSFAPFGIGPFLYAPPAAPRIFPLQFPYASFAPPLLPTPLLPLPPPPPPPPPPAVFFPAAPLSALPAPLAPPPPPAPIVVSAKTAAAISVASLIHALISKKFYRPVYPHPVTKPIHIPVPVPIKIPIPIPVPVPNTNTRFHSYKTIPRTVPASSLLYKEYPESTAIISKRPFFNEESTLLYKEYPESTATISQRPFFNEESTLLYKEYPESTATISQRPFFNEESWQPQSIPRLNEPLTSDNLSEVTPILEQQTSTQQQQQLGGAPELETLDILETPASWSTNNENLL